MRCRSSRDLLEALDFEYDGWSPAKKALPSLAPSHVERQKSGNSLARFFNSMLDWQIGRHYFVMANWLAYRGFSQNYDQISFSLGYRLGK